MTILRLLTICFITLTTLLGCQEKFSGKKPPLAQQGQLDLTGWSFTDDGPLDLSGQWQFVPKKFLTLEELKANPIPNPIYLDMPGTWDVKLDGGKVLDKKSFGTYRLKLLVNTEGQKFAFRFQHRRTAFELYLNGKLVVRNGLVGETSETTKAGILSKVMAVDLKQGQNDLTLYVANFNFQKGGTRSSPRLGEYQSLIKEREASLIGRIFVFGGIFIMALYHFILYLLRRDEKSTIYCGIFCISSLIGGLCEGNMYIANIFPNMSWELYFKIRWIGIILFLFGLVNFFHSVFAQYIHRKIVSTVSYISVPLFLALCVLDFNQYIKVFMTIYLPFLLIVVGYLFISSIRAWKKFPKESLVITSGLIFWVAAVTNDILNANFVINTKFVGVYGLFVFIFSLATLLSMRFSWAFRDLNTAQVEIKKLNTSLENMVKQKTADIRSMMIHIRQGIFALAGKGSPVIQKDYSRHLEEILDTDNIAGGKIENLLLESSSLNSDERNIVEETIKFSMIGDSLTYDLNEHNLPKELVFQRVGDEQKILEIDWGPIANADDCDQIDKVLVCIRDVSEQRKLMNESRSQQRELAIIDEILKVKPDRFNDFIETSQKFFAQNRKLIEENKESSEDALRILFINMHTVKGNARTYHFQLMTGAIHEAEQAYSMLQKKECEWDQAKLLSDLDQVEEIMDDYLRVNIEKLGRKKDSGNYLAINGDLIKNIIDTLIKIENNGDVEKNSAAILKVQSQLHRAYYHHIVDVFKEITNGVSALANDLKKESPAVEIASSDILLTRDAVKVLNDVFVHILRNSMDHGIENAETRKKSGKKPTGKIAISFVKDKEQLIVNYQDDGQGLNLSLLKDKGVENGLFDPTGDIENAKVAELIFESGLSTASQVSDISGRGVGMDAVRSYLNTNGGAIDLEFTGVENDKGCIPFAFKIILPSSFCVDA